MNSPLLLSTPLCLASCPDYSFNMKERQWFVARVMGRGPRDSDVSLTHTPRQHRHGQQGRCSQRCGVVPRSVLRRSRLRHLAVEGFEWDQRCERGYLAVALRAAKPTHRAQHRGTGVAVALSRRATRTTAAGHVRSAGTPRWRTGPLMRRQIRWGGSAAQCQCFAAGETMCAWSSPLAEAHSIPMGRVAGHAPRCHQRQGR